MQAIHSPELYVDREFNLRQPAIDLWSRIFPTPTRKRASVPFLRKQSDCNEKIGLVTALEVEAQ